MAIRCLIETVACLRIIEKRNLVDRKDQMDRVEALSRVLVAKLHTFRKSLKLSKGRMGDASADYIIDLEA
jgi:hypothetical protein